MTEDIDYKNIRRRVEQRYDDLKNFFIHMTAYLMANASLWIMFGTGKFLGIPIVLTVFLLWGIGFFTHAVYVLFDFVTARARENAIRREIEIELYHRDGRIPSFIEKPKRSSSRLRLSDDGELIPVDDDEYLVDQKY